MTATDHDYTHIPHTLSLALAVLMQSQDMTGQELARRSGVSRPYISDLLHGKKDNPGVKTLMKIADALGVTVSTLVYPDRVQVRIKHDPDFAFDQETR